MAKFNLQTKSANVLNIKLAIALT